MASEIVVGIDFGTTHSGVSWAVNGGSKNVRLITDWPNPLPNANSEKVPTTISYKDGKPHNWGYNVGLGEDSFKWFKILLDPDHKLRSKAEAVVASSALLRSLNKTAEDVAADYLRIIWEYAKEDISRMKGDNWESMYNLKVVLTVPAIWSPAAKDKTEKVARAAGLPKDISLVSEPEAAALAVMKEKNDEDESLEVGDVFVVCDAGGGTVDLISYKITGLNPLQMEECAKGDGGLCGSVLVDSAFEKYIKTLVGEDDYNSIKQKPKVRMMREFEMGVKRCYTGDNKEFSVDLPGVDDNPKEGIMDDTIRLKPGMLRTVFDFVINQIVNLVDNQIDEVQERGQRVKAILLVGGFGSSKYMYQRLKNAHRGVGIQVLQVNGAWSSICRGATLWGLENATDDNSTGSTKKTVTARIARHSYGICACVPFDATRHLFQDRVRLPDGNWWANNQMQWLLKRGERVEVGKLLTTQISSSVQVGFFDSGIRSFSQQLWFCPENEPPSRKTASVKELCTVQYGIDCTKLWLERSYRDPQTKQKWRDATFDLLVLLDSAKLHFLVAYKDEPVAYTDADYRETAS
ncbi:actin-like ATPase domain-containing protein [Delitschia confertaspora ATCC 74209]|uniref:Actin-like ATPase domain-containing protein n=1 Tax=Delitschia confertaspora ATCC 74209 TaxID=1513339 RepID=A0A9P4JKT8_9PLEO|nr:actin-like ATPase domain-containing protein [Delitschia confertaspora ATCC 74209]